MKLDSLFKEFHFVLYIAILGFVLFFIDFVIDRLVSRSYESKIKELENEKNEIKATLYDKGKEETKEQVQGPPPDDPPLEEDTSVQE